MNLLNFIFDRIRRFFRPKKDIKKESYYSLLMSPATMNDFKRIFNFDIDKVAKSSNRLIFKEIPWGSGFKEVEKKYLKPSYIIKNEFEGKNHHVWFYKVKTNDHKTITQLHFLDNKLSIVTRVYRDIMRQNIPNVLQEVFDEYQVDAQATSNQYTQVIDEFGSLMQISIDFSLQYQLIGNYKELESDLFSKSK